MRMFPHTALGSAACLAGVLVGASQAVDAQTAWDGGGGDDFIDNALNWDGDVVPTQGAGETVQFGSTGAGPVDLNSGLFEYGTVELLSGDYSFLNGTLRSSSVLGSGAGNYVFSSFLEGSGGTLFAPAVLDFNLPNATAVTVDGVIQDPAAGVAATALGVSNGTTLSLGGVNTFTGGTQITNSTVLFSDASAFGAGALSSPGGGGAIAPIGDQTIANQINLGDANSSNDLDVSAAGGGNLIHTGTLNVTNNGRTLGIDSGVTYTLQGDITGTDPFSVSGGGVFALDGAKTFSNTIFVENATVSINNNDGLGSGILNLNNANAALLAVGNPTIAGQVTVAAGTNNAVTVDGDATLANLDFVTRSGIDVTAGSTLTVTDGNVTTNGNRVAFGGDGVTILDDAARLLTNEVRMGRVASGASGNGRLVFTSEDVFQAGAEVWLRENYALSPGSDVTLDSITVRINDDTNLPGHYLSGVDGGSLTFEAGSELFFNQRGALALVDNARITLNADVLDANSNDRFALGGGDGTGTVVVNAAQGSEINSPQLRFEDGTVRFSVDDPFGSAIITFSDFGGNGLDRVLTPVGDRSVAELDFEDDVVGTIDGSQGGTLNVTTTLGGGDTGGATKLLSLVNGGSLEVSGTLENNGSAGSTRTEILGDGSGVLTISSDQSFDGDFSLQGGDLRFTTDNALGGSAAATISGDNRDAKLVAVGDRTIANGLNIASGTGDLSNGLGISGAEGTLTVNGDLGTGFFGGVPLDGGTADGVIKLHNAADVTINGTTTVGDDLLIDSDVAGGNRIAFEGDVTVADLLGINAGATVLLNGTGIATAVNVDGGVLGGTGSLTGNINVNADGVLSAGASAGTLTVGGDVHLDPLATLLIELGGTAPGASDLLALAGTLTAGGTLEVSLIDGFNPTAGDSFDVLDFAAASGAFDAFVLPTLDPGLAFNTDELLTTGVLSVEAIAAILLGDANNDGVVSAADFAAVQAGFGDSGPADGTLIGDANGDGVVSAADFASVQANFGNSAAVPLVVSFASLSTASFSTIPEPTTLVLFGLGGAAVLVRRRNRRNAA